MPEQESLNLLTIFLASPGDLQEEREIAVVVANEVNAAVAEPLGWHINLLGWEDTLPGYSRPQDIINQDVDRCDLFVGLLWRRWGEPTGKGDYTSGFHEEFELAKQRHRKFARPEIWLFFKDVEADLLDSPGEQLQNVITFKQLQKASKEIYYKEFADGEDWRSKFREYLSRKTVGIARTHMERARAGIEAQASPGAAPSSFTDPRSTETEADIPQDVSQSLAILREVSDAVSAGELTYDGQSKWNLSRYQVARLSLLSNALASVRITHAYLGSHEINLLYKSRESLICSEAEMDLIFRTLLSEHYDTRPGWYWFRQNEDKNIEFRLFLRAAYDRESEIRKSALELLNQAKIRPEKETLDLYMERIFDDDEASVRKAALSYLNTIARSEDLKLLEPLLKHNDADTRSIARATQLAILSKTNPDASFKEAIRESETPHTVHKDALAGCLNRVKTNLLLNGLEHQDSWIRENSARELIKREELPGDGKQRLLDDSSPVVREIGYRVLIADGKRFDPQKIRKALEPEHRRTTLITGLLLGERRGDPEEIIALQFAKYDRKTLENEVKWYSIDGPIAYRVFGTKYFSQISERIRNDLANDFENLIEDSFAKWADEIGQPANKTTMRKLFEEHDEFIQRRFTVAALSVLNTSGDARDLRIARRYSGREFASDIRIQALKLIGKFGKPSDINAVLAARMDFYGLERQELVQIALEHTKTPQKTVGKILDSQETADVKIVLKFARKRNINRNKTKLQGLLTSDNTELREIVLAYLIINKSSTALEKILNEYVLQSTYYYNVVSWIDRILYTPTFLRQAYLRKIARKLA